MTRMGMFAPLLAAASLQAQLPESLQNAVGEIVEQAMRDHGTPAVSVAIVREGRLAFVRAYGNAKVNPDVPATPAMRFKVASNSKQIAAAAVLLLAEEKKLSLDDKVSKYLPDLTRANEITLRQLLSHTSGYQDYYPLDYVAPFMAQDTTPGAILTRWAKIPLNFDPGTRYQYSNTNYVAIGQIVEKVSGKPLAEFIRERILTPLGMKSAIDVTAAPWSPDDASGYLRYATGPLRPAPAEGRNWMWAAGELAMTAEDLARWDISLMNGSLLKPASMQALTTEVQLTSGTGTGYALGLAVSTLSNGHRRWSHSGGASGFVSRNTTFPDDRTSITVLTNVDGGPATQIAQKIEDLLFAGATDPDARRSLGKAQELYSALTDGRAPRELLSDDLGAYFTPQAIADFSASLKPLGAPTSFTQTSREDRGGMVHRSFLVETPLKKLRISTFVTPEGRFAQFLISPAAN